MAPKSQVKWSRITSLIVLIVGVLFGALTTSITEVMMWIVGGLYGGYVMANMLKWYWWRFNGYGYFWGMMAGLLSAMFVPSLATLLQIHVANTLYLFPVILIISVVGCFAGTLFTKPEDDAVLMKFYSIVNPWGCWGPIREKVMKQNSSFKPNPDFAKDCANVAVGIIWQLCLTALPIYLVLREWPWVGGIAVILAATSVFLKFNWYDKLEKA
jgi:Na+/proline symporter